MKVSIERSKDKDGGQELVIRLPMYKIPQPSKKGVNLLVASTHGNLPSGCEFNGQEIQVGVNAYIRPGEPARE